MYRASVAKRQHSMLTERRLRNGAFDIEAVFSGTSELRVRPAGAELLGNAQSISNEDHRDHAGQPKPRPGAAPAWSISRRCSSVPPTSPRPHRGAQSRSPVARPAGRKAHPHGVKRCTVTAVPARTTSCRPSAPRLVGRCRCRHVADRRIRSLQQIDFTHAAPRCRELSGPTAALSPFEGFPMLSPRRQRPYIA